MYIFIISFNLLNIAVFPSISTSPITLIKMIFAFGFEAKRGDITNNKRKKLTIAPCIVLVAKL